MWEDRLIGVDGRCRCGVPRAAVALVLVVGIGAHAVSCLVSSVEATGLFVGGKWPCLQFNEWCLSESQDVNTRKRYKEQQCGKPCHKKHRKIRYKRKRIVWGDFNHKFGYLPETDESDSNTSTEGVALKVRGKSNSEHKKPEEKSGVDSLKKNGEVNTAALV